MADRSGGNVGIRGLTRTAVAPDRAPPLQHLLPAVNCRSSRGGSMDRRSIAFGLTLLPLLARTESAPEVTEDGLVRVPSSRKVGVYRAPDIPFARYRRISIGDIPVAFKKNWDRKNPQLKESDRERLRDE